MMTREKKLIKIINNIMLTKCFAPILLIAFASSSSAQSIERIPFDAADSTDGYYLAITPQSKNIKGVIVLLTSFLPPDMLLTETKLHSVAYTNDLLFIAASMKQKLYADNYAVSRINTLLTEISKRNSVAGIPFALMGYDEAGNIALRYTELTYEAPNKYPLQPKAVIGIDAPVDIFGLWRWSERQIKKNYWPGAVGDAKYYLETMNRENGDIVSNANQYKQLTPFFKDADTIGNEQYLKDVPLRLYYDTEIEWQISNRRNSFYDTKFPDGSELINRLLLQGSKKAEFISSNKKGVRNNGARHPTTISIVDEVDCIQWLKTSLGIFDPANWKRPYSFLQPAGWNVELFSLPPEFAPGMSFKGVEDIRFAPGWGDSTKSDYWSYAYLWWLDANPTIDATTLQANLQAYYTGLVNRNIVGRKIPAAKLVPTLAIIRKTKTASGDQQTFSGTIAMLDYMTQKPITLNTIIHLKNCSMENRVPVVVEISPQAYKHSIWKQFDELNDSFSCKNE
jgi:hypothetical protein